MTLADLTGLTAEALRAHRMRYGLSALAIAVGVAAVVLMSSIGEGMHRFIMAQMSQFGTTLVGITPGKVATGGVPGMMGGSARKLTLDDARAVARIPSVVSVAPLALGSAIVKHADRGRRVYIYGVTADALSVWSMKVSVGENLPVTDWDRTAAVVLLGSRLKRELFGDANAVHVRLSPTGETILDSVIKGDTVREVLNYVQFSGDVLVTELRRDVETALREGKLTYEESGSLLKFYEEGLNGYTYLEDVHEH